MNNENNNLNNQNNNMNNQNVGQTFSNGVNQQLNPATSQFVTQNQVQTPNSPVQNNQQYNNMQFNNQQQLNNQYNNNNQVTYNNANMEQPMNNYNPNNTNNGMMQTSFQPSTSNKKDNKKLFIIIGAVVLAVIVIVLTVNKGNNKTLNDYEDSNVGDNNNPSGDTQIFKGFEFQKLSGYQYSVESDGLSVENNNFLLMLEIIPGKYSEAVSYKQNLIDGFKNSGFTVGNVQEQTRLNKKVLTFELNMSSTNIIYFFIESPNENYTYQVMVANSNNDYSSSMIDEGIKICNNSKYIGNYSDYAKNFGFSFNLDKLEE